MKKLIALAIALVSFSALADNRHMVTLSGYETGDRQDRSLDFTNSTGGSTRDLTRNIALNYAYGITDSLQIGFNYKNFKYTQGGQTQTNTNGLQSNHTYGLQVIYNFAHRLYDTSYAAVHYDMQKFTESNGAGGDADKVNTWSFEAGHRFSIGTIWGMNFNYSPSATLSFAKTSADTGNDSSTTNFTLNFVKFDVLF